MKIVFRKSRNNYYSIVSLISAIDSRNLGVDIYIENSLEEVSKYPKDVVVAYSFMSFDFEWVKKEAKILKERGYTLIAGGPHPTADPEGVLNMGFDYVFTGDGEENIIKFIEGYPPNSGRIYDGIKNRISLNHYPPFNVEREMFMPIEIARGCPFACGYCFTPYLAGRRMRYRSIESIIHYAALGVKKGRKMVRFIASNSFGYMSKNGVTPNVEAIEKLLYGLRKVGIEDIFFGTFPSDVRPESVTREVLRTIKRYIKNRSLIIGAQTGSERLLKIINRGHDLETVERALEIASLEGFTPHVDFIFGFPFETKEDIQKTFEFIEKIIRKYNAKIHAHTFMPLPKTPLAKYGAGVLTREHYKFLGRLSGSGYMDGYWHKQQDLAKIVEKVSKAG